MTAEGPRLIEINTNAGGAFLSIAGREAQRGCCQPADGLVAALPTARELEDQVHAMFLDEWHRARGQRPLRSIAIVDDQPGGQYLYPEFELAKKLLSARGIVARIVDARDLVIRNRRLYVGADPVDLVYNRLTDFYFTEAYSEVLRTAYVEDLAVVTPGPRAHALYADKRNLALLGDATELRGFGVPEPVISILVRGIPETREVAGDEEGWWRDRARWFFKPHGGFGSRGTYRGDKMTRRVFAEVMRGRYIAQRLTPPGERLRSSGEGKIAFKVDVRCYAHAGKIQQMAARLYQGQTTNFRTAGGGFAPVFVVDSSSVPPGRTC
jgi:hypothetical protein